MAIDIRPAGYIPQGTFSGYLPQQSQIERQRRLADVMAMQGMETTPVQSPWQALARVAQAGAGAYGNYEAGQLERARFKALGDVMRSGLSPEQLFGTGDPTLMQVAEFRAQQQQRQIEADRQAALLRLAIEQSGREATALAQNAPGVREGANIEAARVQSLNKRAEAAQRFITSAQNLQQSLGTMVPDPSGAKDENGQPRMVFKPAEGTGYMFGTVSNIPGIRGAESVLGMQVESQRRAYNDRLDALAHDLAIIHDPNNPDYEGERRRLPNTGAVLDPGQAFNALQDRIDEAQRAITEAGGVAHPGGAGAGGVTSRPIAPPGAPAPQHPFQGAPGPQLNAGAGEVPRPAQAGPGYRPGVDSGNGAAPLPRITTPADFAALPSGQHFIDPEGNERVKP